VRILFFQDQTPLGDRVRARLLGQGHVLWIVRSGDVSIEHPGAQVSTRSEFLALKPPPGRADLLLVATFPWRLPLQWIAAAPIALNLHSSLLPKWRGAHPEFWAIVHGDAESGVTLHHLSEGFDQGPIVEQLAFPLSDTECLGTLCEKMADAAVQLAERAVSSIEHGVSLPAQPQPPVHPLRAPAVTDQDLEIRPNLTITQVRRLLRGCFPYLKAWFVQEGRRWWVQAGGVVKHVALVDGSIALSAVPDQNE